MSTHKRHVNSYGGTNTGSELFISAINDNYIMGDSGNIGDRTLSLVCPISFGLREIADSGAYSSKAIMSVDGLFRPVSLGGDGDLPRFAVFSDGCLDQGPRNRTPPLTHSASPIYNLAVNNKYLNPLTNPDAKSWSDKHGDSAGHDIDIVARGSTVPTGQYGLVNGLEDDIDLRYNNDYRFLALKGPLVIHGWGYDIDGKPIPNKADNESAAKAGTFTSTGLQDEFMDDWLQKSKTWPVGPVDLRFDRERGVWVSPPANKLLFVKATGDIEADATQDVRVIQGETLYGSAGGSITLSDAEGTALASVHNIGDITIPSGAKFYAYYDTDTCEYWPIGGESNNCPTLYTKFKLNQSLPGDDISVILVEGEHEDYWGCPTGEAIPYAEDYYIRDPLEFFPDYGKYDTSDTYFTTRGLSSYDPITDEHIVIAGPYSWPKLAIFSENDEAVTVRTPHALKFDTNFEVTEIEGFGGDFPAGFPDVYGAYVTFAPSGEWISEITGVEVDCDTNQLIFKRRKIKVAILEPFEVETDLTLTLYPQEVVIDVQCSGTGA